MHSGWMIEPRSFEYNSYEAGFILISSISVFDAFGTYPLGTISSGRSLKTMLESIRNEPLLENEHYSFYTDGDGNINDDIRHYMFTFIVDKQSDYTTIKICVEVNVVIDDSSMLQEVSLNSIWEKIPAWANYSRVLQSYEEKCLEDGSYDVCYEQAYKLKLTIRYTNEELVSSIQTTLDALEILEKERFG